jgi:HK97 family phage major capsid protein
MPRKITVDEIVQQRRESVEEFRAQGLLTSSASRGRLASPAFDSAGMDELHAFMRDTVLVGKGGDGAARARERLQNATLSTYGSEGVGADGGFAVPPEFKAAILQKVLAETSLLSLADQIPTESSSVSIPKDEATPWGGTGIQGYWDGEAVAGTQKKPVIESSTIKLHKLTSLVPVTEELLEDAPAIATYVGNKASDVLDFKITDAFVNGTGAGMPLGILNSPCLVTQAAEGSQVAGTIHGLNLIKMWCRMPPRWRKKSVWLVHPDAEPELMKAGLQIGPAAAGAATGGQLVWMPAGSLSDSPFATLFGRPVIPTQACKQPGTVGDIIFAAMPQYAAFVKGPGLVAETSIHLWFDQGVTAFRFTFRIGGQPWWSAPITDKNGSTTRSAFVALAAR